MLFVSFHNPSYRRVHSIGKHRASNETNSADGKRLSASIAIAVPKIEEKKCCIFASLCSVSETPALVGYSSECSVVRLPSGLWIWC
jgi:hypothetical protein